MFMRVSVLRVLWRVLSFIVLDLRALPYAAGLQRGRFVDRKLMIEFHRHR